MDPFEDNILVVPGYLYPTDIAALDMIGWNIDRDNPPDPPGANNPVSPSDGSSGLSIPVTLRWTPAPAGTGTLTHVVYISKRFGSDPLTPFDLVHRSEPVSGSLYPVPQGAVLADGAEYRWMVTAVNDYAFVLSEPFTFRTKPVCTPNPNAPGFGCCVGNADGNNVVDYDDITEVFGNWCEMNGPSSPNRAGDANCDGCVDFEDISDILANWLEGCP
ncbi:MAG TPA: hypothetical protein DEB06_02415 [Phycisphaerales bacterium]|nr:hypothetical protein [Phycisphaerales bacterium]